MKRRHFTGLLSGAAALPLVGAGAPGAAARPKPKPTLTDRQYWLQTLLRVADPVLLALEKRELHAQMPVESAANEQAGRRKVSHLEALGRLLAGLAPWLETEAPPAELARQARYRELARRGIAAGVDPASPDFMNFTQERQPVVDAAFLAHALLRAPTQLWAQLPAATQQQLVAALLSTRVIKPGYNNWLLFSAIIEAALLKFTGTCDEMRLDYALRQHQAWYKGDGIYGDGPDFHWDYYNSYVIQPMLLTITRTLVAAGKGDKAFADKVLARAQRYAVVQERLICADGSFATFGRSLAYRCGAFQLLGQVALQGELPPALPPGQVRAALTAVIHRTLDAPGTFDAAGWLRIGLCGHQPSIGENYISTGSLYLCAVGFLPLGLPVTNAFWTSAPLPWTSQKIWSGVDVPTDHAYKE
ncbi:DUF2264 domain-containing protein [Hymenobacter sp. H14-R3]|uniref:DUF2264 domain-containing protein n=1 Tax=Hymenobacter sp. H14-R3 TaxID=3046308 RepID=UPI0024B9D218|nr:DUF2264 domain-containing protein [Hymenobacter sp. H14-R3]MDJ0367492.1 DUF2264 domain-containing protein [Hymenobacter sp. H14-R3]